MGNFFSNFFEGLFNIFLFLPYFFSVAKLLRTLLYPWKNLVQKKTIVGFSLNEWFSRITFNAISRIIGFLMRLAILISFLFFDLILIISVPFLILLSFIFIPFYFFINTLGKSKENRLLLLKNDFISGHTLKKENISFVETWFENTYHTYQNKKEWWKLKNLFSIPPLARDWAMGYTPFLDKYAYELTSSSYQDRIKYAIGREDELRQIEQVLSKSEEANVLIVGVEGVGKQTIIDSFAKKIYEGKTNTLLNYKRVMKLNLEAILTEVTDQKQREHFLEELFSEAESAKNVILVIENLEKYISSAPNHIDLTTSIAKFAEKETLQFIATSTPYLHEKFIFKNDKIHGLFIKVDVEEVSKEKAREILLNLALSLEKRYHVSIPFEAVQATVDKSEFYLTSIPFPEKAIEILDTATAAAFQNKKTVLIPDDIDKTLSQITHAPVTIDTETKNLLIDFEKILSSRIIGQPEAVTQLSAALRRSFVLLGKRKKPLAVFLFLGPTGVGKTETAKALSEIFFHNENRLLRFDMAMYQSEKDITNLIGSEETQNPGLLTKAIRDNPYGVLLLDEIEKSNKQLLNIFLTIFDEGYFVDGFGKRVDCKNLIIIATSNAASNVIFQKVSSTQTPQVQTNIINYLIEKNYFSPEFLNRFDGIVVYNILAQDSLFQIGKKIVYHLASSYKKSHNIDLTVSDQTLQNLVQNETHREFGARDLERVILKEVESVLDKKILEGTVKAGEQITL